MRVLILAAALLLTPDRHFPLPASCPGSLEVVKIEIVNKGSHISNAAIYLFLESDNARYYTYFINMRPDSAINFTHKGFGISEAWVVWLQRPGDTDVIGVTNGCQ